MSAYEDIFGKPFDKDDPFGVKSMEASFRKMEDERIVAQYKRQKKEPIERRRDLYLEAMHDTFVAQLAKDICDFQVKILVNDFSKVDYFIEKKVKEYDENVVKPANEYYGNLLKEIDDMELKVVRKSKEP